MNQSSRTRLAIPNYGTPGRPLLFLVPTFSVPRGIIPSGLICPRCCKNYTGWQTDRALGACTYWVSQSHLKIGPSPDPTPNLYSFSSSPLQPQSPLEPHLQLYPHFCRVLLEQPTVSIQNSKSKQQKWEEPN